MNDQMNVYRTRNSTASAATQIQIPSSYILLSNIYEGERIISGWLDGYQGINEFWSEGITNNLKIQATPPAEPSQAMPLQPVSQSNQQQEEKHTRIRQYIIE